MHVSILTHEYIHYRNENINNTFCSITGTKISRCTAGTVADVNNSRDSIDYWHMIQQTSVEEYSANGSDFQVVAFVVVTIYRLNLESHPDHHESKDRAAI